MANPCLKWIGGKRQLIPELSKHVPLDPKGYYEPFVGGGALFFYAEQTGYFTRLSDGKRMPIHLNDSNPHLINVYQQIRDNMETVIAHLGRLDQLQQKVGLARAYAIQREAFNREDRPPWAQAGRFIAMNAWGFNGLCRYNRKGGFNVPVGKFAKTPVLMDKADNLRAVAQALKGVKLTCGDFAAAVKSAKKGDLVYFDPPYIPVNATSDFTSYTPGVFDMSHQRRLMHKAMELVDRGVHVVLSNSDTPTTRALYKSRGFHINEVQARRAVNCNAKKRGKVGELIIVGKI